MNLETNHRAYPLFAYAERERRKKIMETCIRDIVPPVALRDYRDRWWQDVKASDDFLDRVFETYFAKLALPNLLRKTDYHTLARSRESSWTTRLSKNWIKVARSAKPSRGE